MDYCFSCSRFNGAVVAKTLGCDLTFNQFRWRFPRSCMTYDSSRNSEIASVVLHISFRCFRSRGDGCLRDNRCRSQRLIYLSIVWRHFLKCKIRSALQASATRQSETPIAITVKPLGSLSWFAGPGSCSQGHCHKSNCLKSFSSCH